MKYEPRRGLSIPSLTVLDKSGRVIEAEQRRVFRYNAQRGYGADILFGCGTTGEWNCITNAERQRLMCMEVDEVARINRELVAIERPTIEAWVGVTAESKEETLANIEHALDTGADAGVIAPLSIRNLTDTLAFFQQDISDLFDRKAKHLPLSLLPIFQ